MPIAAEHQRLSRREVLARALLLGSGLGLGLASSPLPAPDTSDGEIVMVDGWVLRRSDLSQL